jgi:hypothetical protein
MGTADTLRHSIHTAIDCAKVYRRRRPDLARAHLSHARDLRNRLNSLLVHAQGYETA